MLLIKSECLGVSELKSVLINMHDKEKLGRRFRKQGQLYEYSVDKVKQLTRPSAKMI